jgi:hypothetical protein
MCLTVGRSAAARSPCEVVHALGAAVLRITGGNLRDDDCALPGLVRRIGGSQGPPRGQPGAGLHLS